MDKYIWLEIDINDIAFFGYENEEHPLPQLKNSAYIIYEDINYKLRLNFKHAKLSKWNRRFYLRFLKNQQLHIFDKDLDTTLSVKVEDIAVMTKLFIKSDEYVNKLFKVQKESDEFNKLMFANNKNSV